MARVHVFVDESERANHYSVGAVLAAPATLVSLRRRLRAMLVARERRLHFNTEKAPRRRQLLGEFAALEHIEVWLYQAEGVNLASRAACLRSLLADLAEIRPHRLVLESIEPVQEKRDRQVIVESRYKLPVLQGMDYEHMRSHEEPMLWVIDGVLWAYGAGGDWRRRIAPLVTRATRIRS